MSAPYAKTEPLAFAAAVLWRLRGRAARKPAKELLIRWRRKLGGRFPVDPERRLSAATQEVLQLIASGRVEAWGTPCDGEGNVEDERTIDSRLLDDGAYADPLAEIEIRSDWMAEGNFGRPDRGYKAVRLSRAQFLAIIGAQRPPGKPEATPRAAPLPAETWNTDEKIDPFEETYWNQAQVVLWICSRERTVVGQSLDSCRSGDIGEAILSGVDAAIRGDAEFFMTSCADAERQMIQKLSGGHIQAFGRKNGTGAREAIPSEEWPGLRFYPSGTEAPLWPERLSPHVGRSDTLTSIPKGAADPPFWSDVIFKREEVLAEWPDLAKNTPFSGHSTSITRNVGGRPAKTYKRAAIEKAVKWLDDEGEQTLAETARYLGETATKFDDQGGPSDTTLKDWAREALTEFRLMRATLGGN